MQKRVYCFICGNVKENDNQKSGLFCVPKDKLEEWKRAIGNNELKQTSRLCEVHFKDEDVVRGKSIDGKFYFNKNWRLSPNALPKLLVSKYMLYYRFAMFSSSYLNILQHS